MPSTFKNAILQTNKNEEGPLSIKSIFKPFYTKNIVLPLKTQIMKPIFVKMLLFFSLISAVGCSTADPIYYKPTTMNIPNFKEKGDLLFATNLALSGSTESVGIDVQGAYAITNHLAVQGSYHRGYDTVEARGGFWNSSQGIKRDFYFGECAIGYFAPLGEHETFSFFGGYSAAKIENDINRNGKSSANFNKWFAQLSLGTKHNVTEFVGSVKLADLNYTNLNQTYGSESDIERFNTLKLGTPMVEMGFLMRAGFDNIKIQFQATTSHLLAPRPLFEYDWLTLSGGICFQFNTKKKVTWASLWR
jgi:hypothetical protein